MAPMINSAGRPLRQIVLGFEKEKKLPKLYFSGNLPNTITNNILKLLVIPAGAIIQDGVEDGRQNVKNAISRLVINGT